MAKGRKSKGGKKNKTNGANLGFEETLWQAADKEKKRRRLKKPKT
jgi:hypothetical protein